MFRRLPVRTRLLIVFSLLGLLPAIATSAMGSYWLSNQAKQRVYRNLEGIAAIKSAWIQSWQTSLLTHLLTAISPYLTDDSIPPGDTGPFEILARDDLSKDEEYLSSSNQIRKHLQENVTISHLFKEIFLINREGTVILSTLIEREGVDQDRPSFFDLSQQTPPVAPLYHDPQTDEISLYITVPLTNGKGEIFAIVAGRADLTQLEAILAEKTGLGNTEVTYLALAPDILLPPSPIEGYSSGKAIWPLVDGCATQSEQNKGCDQGSGRYRGYRGKTVLGVYRWLPNLEAALVTEQDLAETTLIAPSSLLLVAGLGIITYLITLFIAGLAIQRFTNQIANLIRTAQSTFQWLPRANPIATDQQSPQQTTIENSDLFPVSETGKEADDLAHLLNHWSSQAQAIIAGFEQRVAERTNELEKRSALFRAAAIIAREASALRDLDQLLNRITELIHERLGISHVGIFLIDNRGEWAILKSAAGETGKKMLAQEHRVRVGEASLVGLVTSTGQPRIVVNTGTDAISTQDSPLPAAPAEMIVPLKGMGKVIGALDLMSTEKSAFDDTYVEIFQFLADQLAIAIENARLFQEMGHALNQLEMIQGQYTQNAWLSFVKDKWKEVPPQSVNYHSRQYFGYRNRGLGVEACQSLSPEARQSLIENRTIRVAHPLSGQNGQEEQDSDAQKITALAVPIRLRGQVFGVLNLRFENQPITSSMTSTFEEIASRLSLVLENTRLLYEAQQRAERERMISEIATKVRASTNVDVILQTAIQELADKLNLSTGIIQIRSGNGDNTNE